MAGNSTVRLVSITKYYKKPYFVRLFMYSKTMTKPRKQYILGIEVVT
jgi:hypothetical protein